MNLARTIALCATLSFSTAVHASFACDTADVNCSGTVTVTDVQCDILVALAELDGGDLPDCLEGNADVNCSGTVTVTDVLLVITLTLGDVFSSEIDADGDGEIDACATACTLDTQCDDGNPCTLDTCGPLGVCYNDGGMGPVFGSQCGDSSVCLFGECSEVECIFYEDGADQGCDDGDPCTHDFCNAAFTCDHTPLPGVPGCDLNTWWCWAEIDSDPNTCPWSAWAPPLWSVEVFGLPDAEIVAPPETCGSNGDEVIPVNTWSCCVDGGGWPDGDRDCDFSQWFTQTFTQADLP